MFEPRNPDFQNKVEAIFSQAPFLKKLGIRFAGCGAGWCESSLEIKKDHLQQDDLVHAGVLATLADHTAGAAAGSLIRAEEIVLTVEFKINLLRAAKGKELRCRAEVLRPGNRISIVESGVFSTSGKTEELCAKALVTLAIVVPGKM